MKSLILAAACTLAVAVHHTTIQEDSNAIGEIYSNLFVHHFTNKEEAIQYVGKSLDDTKIVKWGVEKYFGEERKCVIISPKEGGMRYKVTPGQSTGKLYWQRIDYTGRITNDNALKLEPTGGYIDSSGIEASIKQYHQSAPKLKAPTSGGERLFNWIFSLADDDESGTIERNEINDAAFTAMDTNQDGTIDFSDFAGLSASAVFSLFDDDNSGYIDSSELPRYMIQAVERDDDNERNDNKMLDLKEFTRYFDHGILHTTL